MNIPVFIHANSFLLCYQTNFQLGANLIVVLDPAIIRLPVPYGSLAHFGEDVLGARLRRRTGSEAAARKFLINPRRSEARIFVF
jgi:hypothetical protein